MVGYSNFELTNRDFRRIWLFYVVRDEQEAVYDSEIRESYLEAESYIDYTLWLTGSRVESPLRRSRLRSRLGNAMQCSNLSDVLHRYVCAAIIRV
jgi:hypothetical protein